MAGDERQKALDVALKKIEKILVKARLCEWVLRQTRAFPLSLAAHLPLMMHLVLGLSARTNCRNLWTGKFRQNNRRAACCC